MSGPVYDLYVGRGCITARRTDLTTQDLAVAEARTVVAQSRAVGWKPPEVAVVLRGSEQRGPVAFVSARGTDTGTAAWQ